MYYSAIVLLAMLVLCIENHDILAKRDRSTESPAQRAYRGFLFWVLIYYAVDAVWGVLDAHRLWTALYIDTLIYFIALAIGVLYWTRYTVVYLDEKNAFGKFLLYIGNILFAAITLLVVVNAFTPVLFYVDETGYHANPVRYALLVTLIVLLLMISGYAFSSVRRKRGKAGSRYLAIGFFGLIMASFLAAQLWFPNLPLYSIAYMTGTCLLRTFVVNNEKKEYEEQLEEALAREKCQHAELISARELAYRDALTGVKSKLAYIEEEEKFSEQIERGAVSAFAVAVFDVNNLKGINDTEGHEQGDLAIIEAARAICRVFAHSPVFRIGGDEFAAFLTGEDYENRQALQADFEQAVAGAGRNGGALVAIGMADYQPGRDFNIFDIFRRADVSMYNRKNRQKQAPDGAADAAPV